jgi:hypothetical protein
MERLFAFKSAPEALPVRIRLGVLKIAFLLTLNNKAILFKAFSSFF